MKQRSQILMLAAIALLGLAACQPNPQKEPVVYKGEDYLAGKGEALFSVPVSGTHLSYETELNGLPYVVDAVLEIPETSQYSVTEVERRSFSQADYERWMAYFAPEGTEYYTANPLTKGQLAAFIVGYEQAYAMNDEDRSHVIAQLQKEFEEAPDEIDQAGNRFSFDEYGSMETFYAFGLRDEGGFCVFSGAIGDNHFLFSQESYALIVRQSVLEEGEVKQRDFEGDFPISREDAIAQARAAVEALGADNMEVDFADKACCYHAYQYQPPISKGWEVVFTRHNNGLPAHFVDGADLWSNEDAPVLGAPWYAERINVFVNENGVAFFEWHGAGQQTKIILENVEILSFERILERAERQLMYRHLANENAGADWRLVVKEIRLASALVSVANKQNIGRMIPVWEFVYDMQYGVYNGVVDADTHVLTLNAIDGSYIEPRIVKSTIEAQ